MPFKLYSPNNGKGDYVGKSEKIVSPDFLWYLAGLGKNGRSIGISPKNRKGEGFVNAALELNKIELLFHHSGQCAAIYVGNHEIRPAREGDVADIFGKFLAPHHYKQAHLYLVSEDKEGYNPSILTFSTKEPDKTLYTPSGNTLEIIMNPASLCDD
jgi:hypothetical protein